MARREGLTCKCEQKLQLLDDMHTIHINGVPHSVDGCGIKPAVQPVPGRSSLTAADEREFLGDDDLTPTEPRAFKVQVTK